MNEFYIKDNKNNYIPITIDVFDQKELEGSLIVVNAGNDNIPSTDEALDSIGECMKKSSTIIKAMKNSNETSILILPHIVRIELVSKRELDGKTICVIVDPKDDLTNSPEIRERLKILGGKISVIPAPITIKEYEEVKAIKERAAIRKSRSGGGLDKSK